MSDPARRADRDDEADSAPPLPGWLKVLLIGVAVVVLAVVVLIMMVGGHEVPAH